MYYEPFLHYYLLEEIYGTDSTTGANVADSDTDKGQTKQEDVNEEHLDADLEVCANGDVLMDFNANLGVTKKTKVSVPDQLDRPRSGKRKFRENSPNAPNCGVQVESSISMEEMSEKYGSNMASSAASTRFKIDGLGLKVDSLVLRIDGVVNALYQAREVPDLQAKIVNELNKLEGLYDTQVFQVVNILAPKHDFPRVILPWLKR